jgi:hypothetical protein
MTANSKNRRYPGTRKPATVDSTTREEHKTPASTDNASRVSRRKAMKVQTDVKAGGLLLGIGLCVDIDINISLSSGSSCKPKNPCSPSRC